MTIVQPLLNLQEVDGRIRELEIELKDLPRRKALELARLNGVSADLTAAKASAQYTQSQMKGYEEDAKSIQAKIVEMKNAQMAAKTNKEYSDYTLKIEQLERDLEAAQSNFVAKGDDMPTADAQIAEAQTKYDSEKAGVDEFCKEIDERIAGLEADLKAAQAERAEAVKGVTDPKMRLYYERLRTKRWPVVVPLTADGVCDGCHLVQPPHVGQLVERNNAMVACTMCGRILYRD